MELFSVRIFANIVSNLDRKYLTLKHIYTSHLVELIFFFFFFTSTFFVIPNPKSFRHSFQWAWKNISLKFWSRLKSVTFWLRPFLVSWFGIILLYFPCRVSINLIWITDNNGLWLFIFIWSIKTIEELWWYFPISFFWEIYEKCFLNNKYLRKSNIIS